VPRLAGNDDVERPTPRVPLLERPVVDDGPVPAGDRGHARVRLDADDVAAAVGEEPRHLPGAAANVEDAVRPIAVDAIADEGVDEGGRVRRSGPVVALGIGSERLGPPAVLVQHRPIMPSANVGDVPPSQTGATTAPWYDRLRDGGVITRPISTAGR
jgi:hypothetical protein